MFTGGFTVLTGLAGAGWSLIIENEIIGYVENDLKFKKVKKAEELEAETATTSPKLIPPNSSQADSIVNSNARKKALEKVAEDLHKLESAWTNGILTDTEFNVKKLALENKIDEYEVEFLIEEKIDKFQKAFSEGILNADEYEDKVKDVEEAVRKQIFQGRYEKIRIEKIAKLKEALDNGILTEEEYQAKITSEWGK
jgi:Short C-terminal domain